MYQVSFEADVNGIDYVKRFVCSVYVVADDVKGARDKTEAYIKTAYSDTYAILEIVSIPCLK